MKERSLEEMDNLSPHVWSGEFSDGRTYICCVCNRIVQEDRPVVVVVDEADELKYNFHPSCFVSAQPYSDLAFLIRTADHV